MQYRYPYYLHTDILILNQLPQMDINYKMSYPEQNFDRGKNQLVLLGRLEAFLKEQYHFKLRD